MRWKISNNAPRSVIGDNSEIHTLSRHASWLQCNLSICYRIHIFCPYPLLLSEPTLSTRPQISKVRRAADGKLLMRAAPTNSDASHSGASNLPSQPRMDTRVSKVLHTA